MIKVAFLIDVGWMGGLNYFRSLVSSIADLPNRKIQPVLITGTNVTLDESFSHESISVLETSILNRHSLKWFLNKFTYGFFLRRFLIKNGIDVLSHSGHSGNKQLKTIGWIPDFQHRYLPHFFAKKELKKRDEAFYKLAKNSDRVILSSEDSYKDFVNEFTDFKEKADVLNFVSIPVQQDFVSIENLRNKYNFHGNYVYLPNQFWIHKNHFVVIDAIKRVKKNYPDVLVIATGSTFDYRFPGHFEDIKKRIRVNKIDENFLILGSVPYEDVTSLMNYSIATINPSLFEGWSTSVEEAKSLGVLLVVSDIPVHREQLDSNAIYFKKNDSNDLAIKLESVLSTQAPPRLDKLTLKALNTQRRHAFARKYQEIIYKIYN